MTAELQAISVIGHGRGNKGCPNHWDRLPAHLKTKSMLRREKLWDDRLSPRAVLEYRCKGSNYFSNETFLYDLGEAKRLKLQKGSVRFMTPGSGEASNATGTPGAETQGGPANPLDAGPV